MRISGSVLSGVLISWVIVSSLDTVVFAQATPFDPFQLENNCKGQLDYDPSLGNNCYRDFNTNPTSTTGSQQGQTSSSTQGAASGNGSGNTFGGQSPVTAPADLGATYSKQVINNRQGVRTSPAPSARPPVAARGGVQTRQQVVSSGSSTSSTSSGSGASGAAPGLTDAAKGLSDAAKALGGS